ncbi:EKC/KEOPS complex subunit Tp53rkb isoform X1 [Microplitis mediator]|uniref:EKC/KEOPS complex subunit Tp53rkb isoform X1 n=1 Tax=Microplitis mediator TaxID=375433 RepID=UPI00255437CD|nr:EKC/KEOPS complex subunit Tp53rkb isoform X1 [Microplitis mediator]
MGEGNFELICQGAEARLYRGTYLGKTTLKKERFKKNYRHPDLDDSLTKDRIKSEVRAIVRAKTAGVATPAIYLVDLTRRSIYMEYIENAITLKIYIEKMIEQDEDEKIWIGKIGKALGLLLAKLHSKNIIHGDLTTSNILIKNVVFDDSNDFQKENIHDDLVVIDFGLARVDSTAEDKAVDLYVLERSLLSSHSQVPDLFSNIMTNYQVGIADKKQRREIISKYQQVRARGRKRLMIG